nr:YciI family protein [Rhodococcus opacus]
MVTYVHPDLDGWKKHLAPHLQWIADQVESGMLRASGPTYISDTRTAALLFESPDRAALEKVLSTDPFMEHGQVSDLTITEWDPIFGILNPESSKSGQATNQIIIGLIESVGARGNDYEVPQS